MSIESLVWQLRHSSESFAWVSQIRELDTRRTMLRQWFLDHPLERQGDEHWIDVCETTCRRLDLKAVEAYLGADAARFRKEQQVIYVRPRSRTGAR